MNLSEIIQDLAKDEQSKKVLDNFYSGKLEKWILISIGSLIIIGSLISIFTEYKEYVGFITLIVFTLIIVLSLLSFVSQMKFIISPSKHYITDLSEKIKNETYLISKLVSYDHWSLKKARERLQFESQKLEKRVGSLVGALDKLGMFPAILGLYAAYSKVFSDNILSEVPYFILGLFAGSYLAAFSAINIISRLNTMAYILGTAEELALQKEQIYAEHSSNRVAGGI